MEIKSTGLVNLIQPGAVANKHSQSLQPSEMPKSKAVKSEVKVSEKPELGSLADHKAVFALQGNNHVVIQFLDKRGEVVKQFPPKEVIAAYERLREIMKSDFDNEA